MDSTRRNTLGYIAGGLAGIFMIAAESMSPVLARCSGASAHDIRGFSILAFCVGMPLGYSIMGQRSGPGMRFVVVLVILAFAAIWPLMGSRSYAQVAQDIDSHPSFFLVCAVISSLLGVAFPYLLRPLKSRLQATTEPETTDN